jgi:hypothetical protein
MKMTYLWEIFKIHVYVIVYSNIFLSHINFISIYKFIPKIFSLNT